MQEIDFEKAKRFIKKAMKVQKITYKKMANHLQMSESGIKKIFIAKDCSFNRLAQICNYLDIKLGDIESVSRAKKIKQLEFTKEQENFFRINMNCFNIYWKLVNERNSIEEVQKLFQLSDSELFIYLKKLDELELLILLPENKVKLPEAMYVRFAQNSTFLREIIGIWSEELVRESITNQKDNDFRISFKLHSIKKESLIELFEELSKLEKIFFDKSKEDSNFYNDLVPIRLLTVVGPGSPVLKLCDE